MRRGGHHVGIGDGGGVKPSRHQSGDVGHIHHEVCAYGVRHFPESGKVDDPGIGGGTGNNDFGTALSGGFQQGVVVDGLVLPQTIGHDMEIFSGDIYGAAVAQVAAVCQIHAKNSIAGLRQSEECRQIGVGTGMGLDVGIVAAEQLTGSLSRQLLRHVHCIAAAVVAVAGIALGILIGKAGTHRQHDRGTDNVFRSNQLNIALLAGEFFLNRRTYLRVQLRKILHGIMNDHSEASL